jgi:hypothetical protein
MPDNYEIRLHTRTGKLSVIVPIYAVSDQDAALQAKRLLRGGTLERAQVLRDGDAVRMIHRRDVVERSRLVDKTRNTFG